MRLFPQDGEQNRRGVGSHAEARVQFHAPTMNRRGFPRLPHVLCRVREGLRAMSVPSSGQGPFRLAWTEACPDFQKVLPTKGGITSCREKRRSGGLNAEVAAVRTRLKRPPLQCPDSPVRFAFREDCPERSETACTIVFLRKFVCRPMQFGVAYKKNNYIIVCLHDVQAYGRIRCSMNASGGAILTKSFFLCAGRDAGFSFADGRAEVTGYAERLFRRNAVHKPMYHIQKLFLL